MKTQQYARCGKVITDVSDPEKHVVVFTGKTINQAKKYSRTELRSNVVGNCGILRVIPHRVRKPDWNKERPKGRIGLRR